MDSFHSVEKSRKKNRRLPLDLKSELLGLNLPVQEEKSNDFLISSSRLTAKKSPLEPELNLKHWALTSEGFPPGVTVDELKNYGRRRQLMHLRPLDNLRIEEGSVKDYKSEYKRRYKGHNLLSPLKPLENISDKKTETSNEDFSIFLPEHKKSYVNFPRERPILKRPPNNLIPLKNYPMERTTEKTSQYVLFSNYEKRKLLRRSTALKPEGEMANETEARKEYIRYPNPERAQIIRRLSSLRLEGELLPLTTEQREKFISFLLSRRPILEKKKTLLKMEGNFDFLTENHLSYVPHDLPERPIIRKRSTSLKLDGEVEFFPEYKNSFVDFPRSRPIMYKPSENLRNEGDLENKTETKTQFVNYKKVSFPETIRPENNLYIEGEMEISPEYRNNYVDFPRERPFLRKPLNQLKPEGNLQVLTESSERFSEIGNVEKLESMKRPNNLKLEGEFDFLSEKSEKFKKHEISQRPEVAKLNSNLKLEGNMDFVTEKADKFGFLVPEREYTGRRPSSLKLEGEFLFMPEYKRSYVGLGRSESFLKPDIKSSPVSPRKKSKEITKINVDEDKKSNLSTPHKRLNSKRLKENLVQPEKSLKFEVSKDILKKPNSLLEEEKDSNLGNNIEFPPSNKPKDILALSGYLESSECERPLTRPKEFPAFQVLDVKGQIGCQSMMKDVLETENEKSTSEDENGTYRLEVFSTDGEGFHKSGRRVFTNSALNLENREEAENRARKRSENYVKIVKSPEVPNYLLEENNIEVENKWKSSGKVSPLSFPEIPKQPAFVVLGDNCDSGNISQITKEVKRERRDWMPDWMTSAPIL